MGKLTISQKRVISCMQNGYKVIMNTANSILICSKQDQFFITGALFFKLVNEGYIYQSQSYPFDWILTDKGKEVKPKN